MKKLFKKYRLHVLAVAVGLLYLGLHQRPVLPTIESLQPKVVQIRLEFLGEDGHKHAFTGAGAFISSDGSILTCSHLFEHAGTIVVRTYSGQTYAGRIVRIDTKIDLAVVKIDLMAPASYFRLGPAPIVGQQVYAFGSPLSIENTVSVGYVANTKPGVLGCLIQGAPINPGNSGGPLVDLNGRLIGVNVAKLLVNPFQTAEGMGLAVTMKTIRRFVRS